MSVESPIATDAERDAGEASDGAAPGRTPPLTTSLFVVTSLLGSFLLFAVQPMVAKMLLPSLGGTSSVWNTAMVFFQVTLVCGYALAHLGFRTMTLRTQRVVHAGLLAVPLVALPVALPGGWVPPTTGSPAGWTLAVLAVAVGAPFLALATCSPTLQQWFATARATHRRDPYFLYAAGNVGSLAALLAYPVVIEANFSLATQARAFTIAYLALIVLTFVCSRLPVAPHATLTRSPMTSAEGPPSEVAPNWPRRIRWMWWAAVPSSLLLGVTRHITTDVMSAPMLWVAPLSLYLVSYIAVFGPKPERVTSMAGRALRPAAVVLVALLFGNIGSSSLTFTLTLHLGTFFLAALVGHGRLALDRPDSRHLTEFYLFMSIGGAIGGAITTLLAPLVFPTVLEYPLAIGAVLTMIPAWRAYDPARVEGLVGRFDRRAILGAVGITIAALVALNAVGTSKSEADALLVVAAAGAAAYLLARTPTGFALALGTMAIVSVAPSPGTLTTQRSFFGVTSVARDADGVNYLISGGTVHGQQATEATDPDRPLTYYHPDGPVGRLMSDARMAGPTDVAVVGLGAGSLAGYGASGDNFDFYEIDPTVIGIATDSSYFTFVNDSPADVEIIAGDGRLGLSRSEARYDVVVLDAFSSDAIPLHLLTSEAFGTYERRLHDHGVLAVHISNRFFELEPLISRLADENGLVGVVGNHKPTEAQFDDGDLAQDWVFLARDRADLSSFSGGDDFHALVTDDDGPLWTDDSSDLLSALRGF
ncbi:MAG: fused MFS/spermidine synthase [Microthrixaceae bacterium]|nr:fused MFS/spermidine synthase [Microthrixaceae bacterium]